MSICFPRESVINVKESLPTEAKQSLLQNIGYDRKQTTIPIRGFHSDEGRRNGGYDRTYHISGPSYPSTDLNSAVQTVASQIRQVENDASRGSQLAGPQNDRRGSPQPATRRKAQGQAAVLLVSIC